jgi:hypothetical protein
MDNRRGVVEVHDIVESAYSPSLTAAQRISLLGLPYEILHHICSTVVYPSHLASISLSCKTLHDIVEPLLYRTFGPAPNSWGYRTANLLKPFLINILRRPELGDHVRNVMVGEIQSADDAASNNVESEFDVYTFEERDLLVSAIRDINLPDQDRWISAVDAGKTEVYLALLLAKTPKLEELHFVPIIDHWPLVCLIAQLAIASADGGPAPFLRNLSTLSIEHWDMENGFSLGRHKHLLALPSLRTLKCFAMEEQSGSTWLGSDNNVSNFGLFQCLGCSPWPNHRQTQTY